MHSSGDQKLKSRKRPDGKRPLFVAQDAWLLVELPVLFAVAALFPERGWARVAFHMEKFKARLGVFSPGAILRGLKLVLGEKADLDSAFRVAATRTEHHVQIVREFAFGWDAPLFLHGSENLQTALQGGRGAILWIAHFSFNALATKKALHSAGFVAYHLSRPEHGFSKSRFGIRFLNPIRVRAERRYLRDRIIIERTMPGRSLLHARKHLAANEIISITAGAWEGAQTATVSIVGCQLELSVGAPGLAHLTGAPLLPVYTLRDPTDGAIHVTVDTPLDVDRNLPRDESALAAAQMFADRVAPLVLANPTQWRDWEKISRP